MKKGDGRGQIKIKLGVLRVGCGSMMDRMVRNRIKGGILTSPKGVSEERDSMREQGMRRYVPGLAWIGHPIANCNVNTELVSR